MQPEQHQDGNMSSIALEDAEKALALSWQNSRLCSTAGSVRSSLGVGVVFVVVYTSSVATFQTESPEYVFVRIIVTSLVDSVRQGEEATS